MGFKKPKFLCISVKIKLKFVEIAIFDDRNQILTLTAFNLCSVEYNNVMLHSA
jgi:hypothetical protein